jgi:hypothetical protein
MAAKLRAVRDRGAAGVILVNPPGARDAAPGLESIGRSSGFGSPLSIPVMQVTPEVASRMLELAAPGRGDLAAWRQRADEGEVRTVHFANGLAVTMGCTVTRGGARTGIETANVGAVLRGRGRLANEWLVIGAHLDHIGNGEFGSSPAYRGQLHPGADDNASGTAGLLVLARQMSEAYAANGRNADLRSVLFLAFSAEESGLHGSRHFTRNPTVPIENVAAMINMDMIGRLRDGRLSVMGVGTAAEFDSLLAPHFDASGLALDAVPGSSGRSDEANFINAGVPAMHFFTGTHPEYHSPNDRAHTVNPAGARDVLRLIHGIAMQIVAEPVQFTFTQPQRGRGQDRGYASVRLGIRPGMDEVERGVLIDEVSEGTSAADAGLQKGDVIIGWDGDALNDMGELFRKLQGHRPGDLAVLRIIRDGVETEIDVLLKGQERD